MSVPSSPERLAIGLIPVWNDPTTSLQLEQVRLQIERLLSVRCLFVRFQKPEALAYAFEDGEVDLAWTSPILALTHAALRNAAPFASAVRQGATHYHSVLFARADSPLRGPLDLKGQRVAWVAPTSAAGYVFPRVALAGFGLDPHALFKTEMFCFSHGAVVDAVLDHQVEVGATFAVFESGDASRALLRAGFKDESHDAAVRILLVSPPIPSDLWLARPEIERRFGSRLLSTLQTLCNDLPLAMLSVFGAEHYAACQNSSLDELRDNIEHARSLELFDLE